MRIAVIKLSGRLTTEGSRLVAALLRQAGHRVTDVYLVRPAHRDYTPQEIENLHEVCREVDMVMVAVYSVFANRAIQVTDFVRRNYPEMPIVWGGPHCVSAPELSLEHADAVCFGEGDECVVEFVDRFEKGGDWPGTPGMAFRAPGGGRGREGGNGRGPEGADAAPRINEPRINEPAPLNRDLDALPYCDYSQQDAFLLDERLVPFTRELMRDNFSVYPFGRPTFWMLTSRGCPHRCSFCNNIRYIRMFGKNSIRRQSVSRFMDELEHHLATLGFFEHVGFGDDDFFVRPVRELEEFAARYKKNVGLPYTICISANTYKREKVIPLLGSGLRHVQIGVQTGSERVLNEVYDRAIPLPKVKQAVEELTQLGQSHGMTPILDFIVDNPFENRDDIAATYRYLLQMPPSARIQCYALAFFPGTPIYEQAREHGLLDSATRHYSGDVRYQRNWEEFLVFSYLMLQRRRLLGWIPAPVMRALASRPVRAVAGVLPGAVHHRMIRTAKRLTPWRD